MAKDEKVHFALITGEHVMRIVSALVLTLPLVLAGPTAPAAAAPHTCDGRRATMVGTPGKDRIHGTPRRDVIVALGGTDRVDGRGGNDIICGGPRGDLLSGGPGNDRIFGQAGTVQRYEGGWFTYPDTLEGGHGDDLLAGGVSAREARLGLRDRVDYRQSVRGVTVDLRRHRATGMGQDTVRGRHLVILGSEHLDHVTGTASGDKVRLGAGADTARTGRGRDEIFGGSGADRIRAGAARDRVVSGPGSDRVRGDRGNDFLDDGARRGIDDLAGGPGRDIVTDFFVARDGQAYSGGLGSRDSLTLFVGSGLTGRYRGSWDMATGGMTLTGPRTFAVKATGIEWADLPLDVAFEVTGTDEDNRISAGGPWVRFTALAGDDLLIGTRGDDFFDGGAGTDSTPFIGPGTDTCVSVERFTERARPADCENRRP